MTAYKIYCSNWLGQIRSNLIMNYDQAAARAAA